MMKKSSSVATAKPELIHQQTEEAPLRHSNPTIQTSETNSPENDVSLQTPLLAMAIFRQPMRRKFTMSQI
jgi:hypothetical protein